MEYIDFVLDYLKDHKLLAASLAILFLYLTLKNFWLLVKLLVFLVLGTIAVSLFLSFAGKALKGKKELIGPGESSKIERPRPLMAESSHLANYDSLTAMISKRPHQAS